MRRCLSVDESLLMPREEGDDDDAVELVGSFRMLISDLMVRICDHTKGEMFPD